MRVLMVDNYDSATHNLVHLLESLVARAKAHPHGKASVLEHDGRRIFAGLPREIEAGRYHSLAAVRVPDELEVTARTSDACASAPAPSRASSSSGERLTPLGPACCGRFTSPVALRRTGERSFDPRGR